MRKVRKSNWRWRRLPVEAASELSGRMLTAFIVPASRICTFPGALIVGGLPLETGELAVLSQSGSFADYTCQILAGKNIRFSKVIGYGNESDLSAADFLNISDRIKKPIIAGYIEGEKGRPRVL